MSTDPFDTIARSLHAGMQMQANKMLSGVPAELGTITETGLKLDNFKHEVQDYLVADFLATLHLPTFSLVGTTASPVDEEGNASGPKSQRTLFEFEPTMIEEVRVNLAAGLLPGERVLVMPTNGGADFVVMCRVVNNNA
ncbi:hypothetical protein [Paenibacillus thiaminolyticus]|uniref:DUF2577 domain-containing protein n=1 Tax=Paenibacillus thiaminolyticus TaxID=49283 RepID=A0A3A3H4T6_PANTH|nr:hypothetical protein [Paenibacillus thiaminolyticus]RJG26713.1 hypothetical protein DQX05_01385 [Paenibacillus thiaminolyticus]